MIKIKLKRVSFKRTPSVKLQRREFKRGMDFIKIITNDFKSKNPQI